MVCQHTKDQLNGIPFLIPPSVQATAKINGLKFFISSSRIVKIADSLLIN